MNILNKKLLFIPLSLLLLILLSTSRIYSQSPSSEFYQDYTTQLEEYQRSHNKYVLARSNYLKFGTLASEEDAIIATRDMLIQRDEVVVAYVRLLIDEVDRALGLEQTKIDEIKIYLESEADWFDQHASELRSAATLEELVEESDETEKRYEELNSYIYIVFSYISYGEVFEYQSRLVDIYSDLRDKFENIRDETREEYSFNDEKVIRINNWLSESQLSINRSEDRLREIRLEIDNMDDANANKFGRVVTNLQDSRLHMQKAISFMEEVIKEIKTSQD